MVQLVEAHEDHEETLADVEGMHNHIVASDSNLKGGSRPGSGKSLAMAAWDPLEEVSSIVDSNLSEQKGLVLILKKHQN